MAYLMVIDEDEDFAYILATALRHAGHEIDVKFDTTNAIETMEQRPPDLLILDVMFSNDTSAGFELARAMRHYHEKLRDIPIVMLAGVNGSSALRFGPGDIDDRWLPVSDFLEKPVDIDVLQRKVSDLLEESRRQQERFD